MKYSLIIVAQGVRQKFYSRNTEGIEAKHTLTSTLPVITYSFSSQLTPQPQPVPFACGLSTTRKLLPINSVA